MARAGEPTLVVAEAEDKLQGFRRSRASRIRRRNGVGLQKMQDPHAGWGTAGHRLRGSLASGVLGGGDRLHAVLIAEAASLPPWMQLLHPLATIIAKSKLLVLPAYPAAWPQAKKHPFVQASFRFYC